MFKRSAVHDQNRHNNMKEVNAMFHSDNPISEISDDLLDRGNFANKIAMAISSYTSSECLTIGVYGSWGDGKSSLANMIISEIKKSAVKDKYAVINFNPWLYSNKEDLIAQMFKEISRSFKISNPSETVNKAADVIEKTGKIADIAKMLPIPIAKDIAGTISEAFGKYSSALKDGVNEEKELPEIKKEIESALEKNKIKLLISIDDFDRLNQEEIRIMFQVVKVLGNFKNTIYILMMDKDVVVQSLEKVQGGNGEDYLKKIVQVPIKLPTVSDNQLRTILNQEFASILGNELYSEYHELFDEMVTACVIPYINNIRDIKRIMNLFKFKHSFVQQDLNLVDLLLLSCIELYDKNIYGSLLVDKEKLLGKKADLRNAFSLPVRVLSAGEEENLQRKAQISQKCITKLFLDDTRKYSKGNFRRLSDKKYYDSYLSLSLPSNSLSDSLINSVIKTHSAVQLDELIKNEQYNSIELINEIQQNVKQISTDRISIVFAAIKNNFNYIVTERGVNRVTIFALLNSLFDGMYYNEIKHIVEEADFGNSFTKECLIIIDYLLCQEHKHRRMLEQDCYGGCEQEINNEQLEEIENICKNNLTLVKIFDYDFKDFSRLFFVWRRLDYDECVSHIKHHFFQVDNSEAKLIYSLTLRNNESFLINIREIEKYIDITELHNKISNKIKTHLLSKEEKTVVSAFEFYYKNKNNYHIDSNGIVEVLDLMHIGEDEE